MLMRRVGFYDGILFSQIWIGARIIWASFLKSSKTKTLETNRNNGNTSAKWKRQRLNEDRSSTAPYRNVDYDASGIPIDKRARAGRHRSNNSDVQRQLNLNTAKTCTANENRGNYGANRFNLACMYKNTKQNVLSLHQYMQTNMHFSKQWNKSPPQRHLYMPWTNVFFRCVLFHAVEKCTRLCGPGGRYFSMPWNNVNF